ncbi:helix-turn-helix domain-containing protein [Sphingobacterium bambusae]|uniref:Helix-turn-helix domain-containing protein n=1 Tax=Sphingobacterium bambusae TaxID=662858 RepID=A0ABW6BCQ0_9SPHI|nr:AraC family transcriptional regulator [Sphingobacterium bambusae]WPL49170.1 AraC family transcriptional regulator [Sphingobacterium bambusae]
MENDFYHKFISPPDTLADFVENLGMFYNPTATEKPVVIVPDGRIDLFLTKSRSAGLQLTLVGLETFPEERWIPPGIVHYVISFKPLAVEYILQHPIAAILNTAQVLAPNFWGFVEEDLTDFSTFCDKVSAKITDLLPATIDPRKRKLFHLLYGSKVDITVHQLAEQVGWSSRQMNRYFTQQLGLSLKAYANILRFRASLEHIAQGRLFPELNFTDQNHFIKTIKKFAGVVPKELSKNKNDRFILLSVLKQQ